MLCCLHARRRSGGGRETCLSRPTRGHHGRAHSTLETRLEQMAPLKSGRGQECHLIQVAFYGGVQFREVPFALMLSPGWSNDCGEDGQTHGGSRPIHQKSTCLTRLISRPHAVQFWPRIPLDLRGDETRVLHRLEGGSSGEDL